MDVAITKMSSKGQIVIPIEMRQSIKEGEKILLFKNNDQIILKKADNLDTNFKEDIEFAKKTEEAWKRIQQNKRKEMKFNDFLEEMKKW